MIWAFVGGFVAGASVVVLVGAARLAQMQGAPVDDAEFQKAAAGYLAGELTGDVSARAYRLDDGRIVVAARGEVGKALNHWVECPVDPYELLTAGVDDGTIH